MGIEQELHGLRLVTRLTLRFFAGFSEAEIAALLGLSERSVQRHWACAKAWLFERIENMILVPTSYSAVR